MATGPGPTIIFSQNLFQLKSMIHSMDTQSRTSLNAWMIPRTPENSQVVGQVTFQVLLGYLMLANCL